jgi:CRISPR/Cas system CMR-associated protein Cmr5 small subunit
MILKPDNKLIINALTLLESNSSSIVEKINNVSVIKSKYSSYISSFGGCIINSGLFGTIMVFCANEEKKKIIHLLVDIYNSGLTNNADIIERDLHNYLKKNWDLPTFDQRKVRNRLVKSAIALKLAMRTYETVTN